MTARIRAHSVMAAILSDTLDPSAHLSCVKPNDDATVRTPPAKPGTRRGALVSTGHPAAMEDVSPPVHGVDARPVRLPHPHLRPHRYPAKLLGEPRPGRRPGL